MNGQNFRQYPGLQAQDKSVHLIIMHYNDAIWVTKHLIMMSQTGLFYCSQVKLVIFFSNSDPEYLNNRICEDQVCFMASSDVRYYDISREVIREFINIQSLHDLTYCGLVMPYVVGTWGHHCFR